MQYYRPSIIKVNSPDFLSGADLRFSDQGRAPLEVDYERIENRERMANGRMRSKYIADKRTFSLSWEMLPSKTLVNGSNVIMDGGASAADLKAFHESVYNEFTISVYADDRSELLSGAQVLDPEEVFGTYTVFFDSFSMTINKRGRDFDFYDVEMTLEEA